MASIGGGNSAEGAKSQSETFTTRLLIDALSIALSRTFTTCHLMAASISSGVISVRQLCCLAGHWGMIPNFSGLRPRLEAGPCTPGTFGGLWWPATMAASGEQPNRKAGFGPTAKERGAEREETETCTQARL